MSNEKYFYIYNPTQANFFFQNGVKISEIGKGKKDDVYVKFIRDDASEKVFTEWIENKRDIQSAKNN